jgi:hypothetical protein
VFSTHAARLREHSGRPSRSQWQALEITVAGPRDHNGRPSVSTWHPHCIGARRSEAWSSGHERLEIPEQRDTNAVGLLRRASASQWGDTIISRQIAAQEVRDPAEYSQIIQISTPCSLLRKVWTYIHSIVHGQRESGRVLMQTSRRNSYLARHGRRVAKSLRLDTLPVVAPNCVCTLLLWTSCQLERRNCSEECETLGYYHLWSRLLALAHTTQAFSMRAALSLGLGWL